MSRNSENKKQKFVARSHELENLRRLYQNDSFEMAVIFGRRRVGKTALITELISDKPAIYFQAMETSSDNNLRFLSERIDEFKFKDEAINTSSYNNFQTAFKEIDQLAKKSLQKLIFVIDEFPYLAESERAISSILQEIIDHHYQKNPNLLLILCGSSMSFMERQVLGAKSPLYGRRTAQFKIKPFTIFETSQMLPQVAKNDLIAYQGLTGGIPQYLEYVDQKITVAENIQRMFLDIDAPLLAEPSNLLQQELRTPSTYNAIISAIANGKSKYSEIISVANISSGSASNYLTNLIDLGIIEKKTAIYDKSNKKPIYKVQDEMFRFWFRFIEGKIERISRRRTIGLLNSIMEQLPQFLGFTFERACADFLWEQDLFDFEPAQVKSWWGSDPENQQEVEVDLVMPDDHDLQGVIAECKWKNSKLMTNSMITTLIHRATLVPKIRNKELVFFVKEAPPSFIQKASEQKIRVIKFSYFFNK